MATETTIAVIGAATSVIGAAVSVYTTVQQRRDSQLKVHVRGNVSLPLLTGQVAEPMFCITATHKRGPAITMTGIGVLIARGRRRRNNKNENFQVLWPHPLSTQLPGVLTPGGAEAQFFFGLQELLSESDARGIPVTQLWPWVAFGNGERAYGEHLHKSLAQFRRAQP